MQQHKERQLLEYYYLRRKSRRRRRKKRQQKMAEINAFVNRKACLHKSRLPGDATLSSSWSRVRPCSLSLSLTSMSDWLSNLPFFLLLRVQVQPQSLQVRLPVHRAAGPRAEQDETVAVALLHLLRRQRAHLLARRQRKCRFTCGLLRVVKLLTSGQALA